jgi:hypothetical protein
VVRDVAGVLDDPVGDNRSTSSRPTRLIGRNNVIQPACRRIRTESVGPRSVPNARPRMTRAEQHPSRRSEPHPTPQGGLGDRQTPGEAGSPTRGRCLDRLQSPRKLSLPKARTYYSSNRSGRLIREDSLSTAGTGPRGPGSNVVHPLRTRWASRGVEYVIVSYGRVPEP